MYSGLEEEEGEVGGGGRGRGRGIERKEEGGGIERR